MELERVMISQAKFLKGDRESYDKFQDVLQRLRSRTIPSSTAAVSVFNFLDHKSHSDVLAALKPFLPNNYKYCTAAGDADLGECLRFLNRLGTRYPGDNGLYTKFLDFMNAYSRAELTFSEVSEKVVRLLHCDQELAVEFSSFLPDLKRRKLNHKEDRDQEIAVATKPLRPPKPPRKFTKEEDIDFDMEDALCNYEVQIGQLESTYEAAAEIQRCLIIGNLSSAYVRVNKDFPALNLCCIRKIYKQVLVNDDMIQCDKLPKLMRRLMKKKETLEKCRDKIKGKWVKIRQSRSTRN